MITEDYVSFEVAKLLREKGFREICNKCYGIESKKFFSNIRSNDDDTMYAAPTLQMAMKWLREVHKVDIAIYHELNDESTSVYYKYIGVMPGKTIFECKQGAVKYEQAVENAIKWVLENLIGDEN